ncbi:hypothetical protein WL93_21920 [Burkholderia diffusa]|uniref:hypothetical protein n=1 Tax=Burkholderia diffusa TaxID=488732 RepID=UPI00075C8AC5|nr:hypothetical protein [Burkholderia diffusa]KWF83505.1 hypothetical protein WL93_21920 [Burkholderia diffusa]
MAVLAACADVCLRAGCGADVIDWLQTLAVSAPRERHRWRNNLAAVLFQERQVDRALVELRGLTAEHPEYVSGWLNYVAVLKDGAIDDEYEAALVRALEYHPGQAQLFAAYASLRETTAVGAGRALLIERFRSMETNGYRNEDSDTVAVALAHMDGRAGEMEEQIAILREALARGTAQRRLPALQKESNALACTFQGFYPTLRELRQPINWVPWELALAYLGAQRWREGFASYESRLLWWGYSAGWTDEQKKRRWCGQDLGGATILVTGEQGYGDQIQFARFALRLKALGAEKVILGTNGPLKRLLQTLPGIDTVIALGDTGPPFDWHVPVCSLPFELGIAHSAELAAAPYLHVPDALRRYWRGRLDHALSNERCGKRPRIGLCWAGKSTHAEDAKRSIPFEQLRPLMDRFATEVDWIRLQPGMDEETRGLCCIDREINDFLDLAALLVNCDLLITVDSAPVHLAGALGVPAWLMNRHFGDWRWPRLETRNAWYESVEVFHQAAEGCWSDVMDIIAKRLAVMVPELSTRSASGTVGF